MGASLVRCSEPRDADEHIRLLRHCKLDWWNAVPAMVRRFAEKNRENLTSLGIVGGAAIEPGTSTILAGSALRVGYGQTEASPHYNPHFRQLLHVGFKVAAGMGKRFTDALEANEQVVGRNVTENLFDRHLRPIFG